MLVFYENSDSETKLKSLMLNDVIPFPAAYSELGTLSGGDFYRPTDKSIDCLQRLIEFESAGYEQVAKQLFFIKNHLLPKMYDKRFDIDEIRVKQFLVSTLEEFRDLHARCYQYLQNDKYSKEKQLEKRRERRRRYKNNKKNNVSDWTS